MSLRLTELCFRRGERDVLGPLSLEFGPGELIGVVGPNGSGKSTLLRVLYGFLPPSQGTVELEGQALETIPPRTLAQRLGACPQEAEPSLDFSVEQALALGAGGDLALTLERARHFPFLALEELRGRLLSQLSGGEKQRVRLARALLPKPPWLILDEPANHLDLATGWSLLSYLSQPRTGAVVVALHDLASACRFCHRLLVLRKGQMVAFAPPSEALDPSILESVFGLRGFVRAGEGQAHLEIAGVA